MTSELFGYYPKSFVMKWSSKLKCRVIKMWFKRVSYGLPYQNLSDFLLLQSQFHTALWKMGVSLHLDMVYTATHW